MRARGFRSLTAWVVPALLLVGPAGACSCCLQGVGCSRASCRAEAHHDTTRHRGAAAGEHCAGRRCDLRQDNALPARSALPAPSAAPEAVLVSLLDLSRAPRWGRFEVGEVAFPDFFSSAPLPPPPRFLV